MLKRRHAVLAVLAMTAASVFVLPASSASAGTSVGPNACQNTAVPTDFSQLDVTINGTSPASVAPGDTFTLSGIDGNAAIPGAIFVAGYNLGLLVEGPNTIPINAMLRIEGTNTVEGQQNTNRVGGGGNPPYPGGVGAPDGSVTVVTTVDDPNDTPGDGDETATDAVANVSFADQTWTADNSGLPIEFREQSATAFAANNGGLLINAFVGNFLGVQFRCWPGTLVPPPAPPEDPNTVVFQDPAPTFSTTNIVTNTAPTANAGADQTVNEGATVNLDGTGSTDPEGDALTYAWTQTAGPAVTLSGANTATPSFTAPQVNADTPLTFQLEVCDQEPLCDTATVTVTVLDVPPVDNSPNADAGADQTVNEGATVNLDGSASADPDGETLTYSWTAPAGITLTGANTANPTFTAPQVDANTPFPFVLQVCDEANPTVLCDTDTVVVNVLDVPPVNTAPTANAGADQTVNEGATVNLDGTGSTDPEGNALTYAWTQTAGPAVTLSGANTATPSFTAPQVNADTPLTFQLEVCDQEPLCDTATVTVTVLDVPPVNTAPTANAGADQTVNEGATVNLDGTGSTDPEGDALTYAWTQTAGPAVTLSGANTATPSFTAPQVNADTPLTFQLEVCDQEPLCDTATVTVTVLDVPPVDNSPNADAGADQTVNEGATVNLDGSASADPDGETLTYSWTAPAGITLTGANTANPTFTAPQVDANTPFPFVLQVCDEANPTVLCDTDTVVVNVLDVPPVNTAPTANAGADQTVNEGATVNLDGTGSTDPEGNALTYAWTQTAGPAVTLSGANTATPSFTAPQVDADTPLTFQLEVCDQEPLCDTDTVTVTVLGPGSAAVSQACQNTADPANLSQLNLTISGTSPASVAPGDTFTLSGISGTTAIPGAIFVAGYNLGLLVEGPNTIPINAMMRIEGTNTVEGQQDTNRVGGGGNPPYPPFGTGTPPDGSLTVATTVDDPNDTPGDGDETATDAVANVSFADQTWTADNSGLPIEFREQSGTGFAANDGGLLINAFVGNFLGVQFRCWPGTLVPPPAPPEDPNTPQFQDPAPTFSTTNVVPPVNTAPTANAGADQTVNEGATVNLDGTGSTDPEGDALTYAWTQTAGPAVTLSGANTATPSFTAPQVNADTPLTFQLEVCDQEPLCDTATVTVTVLDVPPVDNPPNADAGADQTVDEGDEVMLDGTGSADPDGEALTYAWTQTAGPAVTLTGANTATPSFTAPQVTANTPLTFQLEVCDEPNPASLCDTDTVVVTVRNLTPPVKEIDAAVDVIVLGKVFADAKKDIKLFFVKVQNRGKKRITVRASDVKTTVKVNGATNGSTVVLSPTRTINPGRSAIFPVLWAGTVKPGDRIQFNGCVNLAGDSNTANNCDSETRTAVSLFHH